jgi:Bacterial PH domain
MIANEIRSQAVAGLTTPEFSEARLRIVWPTVAANFAIASLGKALIKTILLAPIGWIVMAGGYFGKVLPILGRRYLLTNRRVVVQKGWSHRAGGEMALAQIDEIRVVPDSNSEFFRSATVELIHEGKVALTLPGVREPEAFRQAVLNACAAWVPGWSKKAIPFIPASK